MRLAARFGSFILSAVFLAHATPARAQLQIGNLYGITPAIVEEAITVVSAEAPLIDPKSPLPSTTVSRQDLDRLPLPRDTWAVLQQVPGVLVDRINVGGNQTGFSQYVVGQGTSPTGNTFILDGVDVTDLGSVGFVPSYFDVNPEVVNVTVGSPGTDYGTGGGVINMITKRGTNDFHGSGRYFHTDDYGLGSSDKSRAPLTPIVNHADDYGVQLGGPIVKDRLWFFGGLNRQSVDRQQSAIGVPYDAANSLKDIQANGSFQLSQFDSLQVRTNATRRDLLGPSSLTRSLDATWNHVVSGNLFKIEERHLFNDRLSVSGAFAYVNPSITLEPRGGSTTPSSLTPEGLWTTNYFAGTSERPRHGFRFDATRLFEHRWGRDTLNLGLRYDQSEQNDAIKWPGDKILLRETTGILAVYPGANHISVNDSRTTAWGEKSAEFGRATLYGGVSVVHDTGSVLPSNIDKNPILPTFVPGFSITAPSTSFRDNAFLPRLGLTYAPGAARKTLLRASYSRYADLLGTAITNFSSPIQGGDSVRGALVTNGSFVEGYFPPLMDDLKQFAVGDNRIDPDLTSQRSDQLLFGAEHSLLPECVVGVNLTFRRITGLLDTRDLVGSGTTWRPATAADYTPDARVTGTLPTGEAFSSDLYRLRLPLQYAPNNGVYLTNSDASTNYKGVTLTFNKRLSNRWMLRGNFTYSDWTWSVPDSEKAQRYPGLQLSQGGDGEPVSLRSPAPDMSGIFMNSKWSYDVNGLYEFGSSRPLHFGVAANATGFQGFPLPYYAHLTPSDGRPRDLRLVPFDALRAHDVTLIDARLFLRPKISWQAFEAMVILDLFNVAAISTARQYGLNMADAATRGTTLETIAPRTARLGIRFDF